MKRLVCWPEHTDCDHRDYIGKAVTYNGKPAIICIDSDGYAQILIIKQPSMLIHYAWTTIFSVCDNRGADFGVNAY